MKYFNKMAGLTLLLLWGQSQGLHAQALLPQVQQVAVGEGWANNSVNTVVFRKNAITSLGEWQYIAYYNKDAQVVLGKRKMGAKTWELVTTRFSGKAADAHNSISIMVDGTGHLHMCWDHHGNQLRYSRSQKPHTLDMMDEIPMTGLQEQKVTYPEFYRLANGHLVFMYRDGQSGSGNLVMNQYNTKTKQWHTLHANLISGEGKRNAYWQAATDAKGAIHLSWVWRESPDVASNHDLCYARSTDGGKTWQQANGTPYTLPITAATAEYAARIPQKSELINQTSMTTDKNGNPFIATYWRDEGETVPQYRLVHYDGTQWQSINTGFRTTAFSLSGAGTKSIPVSRPQVLVWYNKEQAIPMLLFRDAERGSRASLAMLTGDEWVIADWATTALGEWEPTYDANLWQDKQLLHLFAQPVVQIDGEGRANIPPTPVQVWQWQPRVLKGPKK